MKKISLILLMMFCVSNHLFGALTQYLLPNATYTSNSTLIPLTAADFETTTSVTNTLQTMTFDQSMGYRTVPDNWMTWAAPPESETSTPRVLATFNVTSLTINLSSNCEIFGCEVESSNFGVFNFIIEFFNGNTSLGSFTRSINGDAGSRLMAASSSSDPINKVVITAPSEAGGFAIGQLRYSSSPCTNPTFGGTIAAAQTICNNTAPAAFTNSALPTGHTGTLEYKWQKSTTSAAAGFTDIASSNSATYTSGALTQTTWFKRLARVDCAADWSGAAESNVIRVAILPTTVYVSVNYNSGTEGWGVSHFATVNSVLALGCSGITVNISDNSYTGNLNLAGYTFIIGDEDFSVDGSISGGMIQTTGTGRLMQTAVQNTPRTFPVTDGANNFTVTITPTSESTSGMIGVKLNTGKDEDGALKSPMTFFDIYGNEDLDATVVLRIDKAAISPATMEANTIMRFWNGTRYQPIPTERVSIVEHDTYYIITITNMNYFNEIPD